MADDLAARVPDFVRSDEVGRALKAIELELPLEDIITREEPGAASKNWQPIWQVVRYRIDQMALQAAHGPPGQPLASEGARVLDRPTLPEYELGYEMVAVLYFVALASESESAATAKGPCSGNEDIFRLAAEARNAEEKAVLEAEDEESAAKASEEEREKYREALSRKIDEFLLPESAAGDKLVLAPKGGEGRLDVSFFGDVYGFAARVGEWLLQWLDLQQDQPALLRRRLEEVLDFFDEVRGNDAAILPVSKPKISSVTYDLPARFGEKQPRDVDLANIFKAAHTSLRVPYIHAITDTGEQLIKIYRKSPHILSTPPTRKLNTAGSIYFHVWAGDREVREAFILVKLVQATGALMVKIVSGSAEEHAAILKTLKANIAECYRRSEEEGGLALSLGKEVPVAYAGDLSVGTTLPVEEFAFLHFILLDNVANQFLYAEESTKATTERKQLIVRYSGLFGELTTEKRRQKHPYILSVKIAAAEPEAAAVGTKVSFSKAASAKDVGNFVQVLRRLLTRYEQLWGILREDYDFLRPNRLAKPKKKQQPKALREMTKQKMLEGYSKEIFGTHYATACQKKCQPVVTDAQAYDAWTLAPQEGAKEVLRFRFDNDQPKEWLYLTCETEANPHISLKCSKLPSASRYPFLPCCTRSPSKMVDKYYEYLAAPPERAQEIVREMCAGGKTQGKGAIKTQKILLYEKSGKANPTLTDVMKGVVDDEGAKVFLLGVHIGTSAFLACVLYACQAEEEQMSAAARSALAELRLQKGVFAKRATEALEGLRAEIAGRTHAGLLRQELHDLGDEAIAKQLYDPEAAAAGREQTVLDPALHFRALEEYFGVNVLAIVRRAEANKKETGEADVLMPKNQLFHARVWRYPRTVVVFKHRGNPTKALAQVPAVELVQTITDQATLTLYEGEASEGLGRAFDQLNDVTVVDPSDFLSPSPARRSWSRFPMVDWAALLEDLFGSPPEYQLTDGSGKMRALAVRAGSFEVWCFFGPAPPVNLPDRTPSLASLPKLEDLWPWLERALSRLSGASGASGSGGAELAVKRMGLTAFTGAPVGTGISLSGLWCEVESSQNSRAFGGAAALDFWLPARGEAEGWESGTWTVKTGPFAGTPLPLAANKTVPFAMGGNALNAMARGLENLRIQASVLKQLVRWVYLLWAAARPDGAEGEFGERYLGREESTAALRWDVPFDLVAGSADEAMALIGRNMPGMVKDGRFALSARLRELAVYDLRTYARWIQGSSYLTTDGRLAFKLGWEYQSPTSEGLLREMQEVRGLKKANLVWREGREVLDLRENGQYNVTLADELVTTSGVAESAGDDELVFFDLRSRNRALIRLTQDQEEAPLGEWLLDFPWMSPEGSLRTSLSASDFQIKDPFYYEHLNEEQLDEEGQPTPQIFMIQNVEADRSRGELRAKNLAWTWLTRGVNLGQDAPDEEVDAGLEEYRIDRGQLVKGRAAADKKPLLKVVAYGPGKFGALLDPRLGGSLAGAQSPRLAASPVARQEAVL